MQVSILGTGRAVPKLSVSSAALSQKYATSDLQKATGVRQRHYCVGESQVDLAVEACENALKDTGLSADDIDLVISGSAVPYQPIPAMAPLVMGKLGFRDASAAAFDVNSTCLSFITALETAANMINAGRARRALIFSSEVASRALPWDTNPEVAALFGDGAAAAIVGGGTGSIKAVSLRTYPSAYEACGIGAGGTRFDFEADPIAFADHAKFGMDGKTLFRITAQHFSGFIDDLLAKAGWTKDDVDLIIPHQASPAGLDHMVRQTGFDPARIVRIVEDFGNQIAASIPFALDIARRAGRAPEGAKLLFLGTSAGVSFGGAALEA